jgi:Mce-associated membrane protein
VSITDHDIESTSSDVDDDKKTSSNVDDDKKPEVDGKLDVTAPEPDGVETVTGEPKTATEKPRARVSISVRTLIIAAVICVVAGAIGVLAWLYIGAQSKLNAEAHAASNKKRAEEIAQDYAVHAAEMNFQDLNAWKVQLVKGTSPELKEKLTKAAGEMEQILTPLQWVSTARPLAAKVRSDAGGTYVVDSFVSVLTKTMQAPEGLQSTATYSLTIDSNKDWQISDVGGIDAALGSK